MNCEEVNNHLVDYLDKSLDTATTTRVATHLIACANCGVEAGELTDCIEQVASLPRLDPPLGFAQRVMAHVRELEEKPTHWQRLFLPWGKIPMSATALVMVGVVGIVMYQKDDRLKQSDPSKMTLSAVTGPLATEKKTENTAKPAFPSQSDQKEKLTEQAPAQARLKEAAAAPATLPPNHQIASARSEVEARPDELKFAKRAPIQVQEVISPREPSRFFRDGAGFASPVPFGGLRQAAPSSAPMAALERSPSPIGERSVDIKFLVRRHPPQRRDQVEGASNDSLKKSAEADAAPSLAGRLGATAAPKIESIGEIRFYNVAPEHYEFFKKELANESIIESESKANAKEKEIMPAGRELLIEVTILPAASQEPSTPSR
ncbi:MAG: zf-HC2 domain-containing protein [Deltaproteobacteria bacterium]|nr:zf-HC2 domain-containing protein [Deltaproteobacteria bacterium]